MAFTTSTRDDVSLHLKAQNITSAKTHTKQLEHDNRKMEERLYELKMAMNKERETRERQGGGFWQTGQEGSLNSVNKIKDMVAKTGRTPDAPKSSKPTKTRKVKVLKDEPTVLPSRPKHPGTMAKIADRDISGRQKRVKGPRCGQCEQTAAHVSCYECGEDYCAGCFASFHLRGALKKHRSMPIGHNEIRTNNSQPLGTVTSTSETSSIDETKNPMKVTVSEIDVDLLNAQATVNEHSNGAQFTGPSLLDGVYNEEDNRAEFQNAIAQWRGEDITTKPTTSPTKTATVKAISTDSGTSTGPMHEPRQKLEVLFTNPNISYADRLLLKQHRRGQLKLNPSDDSMDSHDTENGGDDYYDRVDVEALIPTPRPDSVIERPIIQTRTDTYLRTDSRVSIVEIDMNDKEFKTKRRGKDPSINYTVGDGPDSSYPRPAFRTPSPESATIHNSESLRGKKYTKDIPSSTSTTNKVAITPRKTPRPRSQTSKRPSSRTHSRTSSRAASRTAFGPGLLTKAPSAALHQVTQLPTDLAIQTYDLSGLADYFTGGLPTDSTRLENSGRLSSMSISGRKSSMSNSGRFSSLSNSGRTSQISSARTNKYKISNKLYQMAPRSWRPDSSLNDEVDISRTQQEAQSMYEQFVNVMPTESGNYGAEARNDRVHLPSSSPINDEINDTMGNAHPGSTLDKEDRLSLKAATPRPLTPRPAEGTTNPRPASARSRPGSSMSRPWSSRSRPISGRESRSIVVDGDDMSTFDDELILNEQFDNDCESLCQLEYELAEQEGRVTADGKISRMSIDDYVKETEIANKENDKRTHKKAQPSADYQIRESILMDDFDEMEQLIMDKDDVKKLS